MSAASSHGLGIRTSSMCEGEALLMFADEELLRLPLSPRPCLLR